MELYIDPGTGSMLFAILIGIIGAANFAFRSAWVKLKFILSGGKTKAAAGDECPAFVIFSDDKRYWNVFEPLCREMDARGLDVDYLTASEDDAALACELPCVHARFIGAGNAAFARLNTLRARVLLSTTPGLDVYQWKRSPEVDRYVHIFHSVGEAQLYRMFGIDFYDAVLASGSAQEAGVRALEALRDLPEKDIAVVGAPYMDAMAARLEAAKDASVLTPAPIADPTRDPVPCDPTRDPAPIADPTRDPATCDDFAPAPASDPAARATTVLLAPSWGEAAIFGKYGERVLEELIATGYHVIVRPHPQSFTSEAELIEGIMAKFPASDQVEWDRSVDNFESLRRADILVSDFSGIIFEFALVHDKPVIYASASIDKDPYDAWWLPEDTWTERALPAVGTELGAALAQGGLKAAIDNCLSDERAQRAREAMREEAWANRGSAARVAVDYLLDIYNQVMDAHAFEGAK